jgi:dUTP pyrophosphatase
MIINTLVKRYCLDRPCSMPSAATIGSAGFDLTSAIDVEILPMARQLIGTNLAFSFPFGYTGLICPRSGLALKKGLTVLNAPGVIDCDYTGEVCVLLINLSNQTHHISVGDRIAQLLIVEYTKTTFSETKDLPITVRGANGFGSTEQCLHH